MNTIFVHRVNNNIYIWIIHGDKFNSIGHRKIFKKKDITDEFIVNLLANIKMRI